MSDPYNSYPAPLPTNATPAPHPTLKATVVLKQPRLATSCVAPVNWATAVVFLAIAISKHAPFGATVLMLTPYSLALLSGSAFQSRIFNVIARVLNANFALLALLKLSARSPTGAPMLALILFAIMVLVPAFNAVFLQPRKNA